MEAVKADITCRLFQEKDIDGILRLWEQNSGWGAITREQFNDWYINTPYGESLLIVATDENDDVKGQIAYSPSQLLVDGERIKSMRASAPILAASLRHKFLRSAEHPAFMLIQKGFEEAAKRGIQFIYAFPAFGWKSMLQSIHQQLPYPGEIAYYDCFSIDLQKEQPVPVENYTIRQIEHFSSEHGQFWELAAQENPACCTVYREPNWMNWAAGNQLKLEVRSVRDDTLICICCLKKDGLIGDLVARNKEDLRIALTHIVWVGHHLNPSRIAVPFSHIKGMMTREIIRTLETIAYTKEDFCFVFDSYLLDSSLDYEKFKTANWYLTPLG